MINFYIKSVTAYGEGRTTSAVKFIDGINIIRGESDTGKTKVMLSILYAMGGSHKPFAKKTGYDTVQLVIDTPNGEIQFTRKYSSTKIEVISENEDIEDGTYSTRYDTDWPPVNRVWLKLMGMEGEPRVAFNAGAEKRRLTWNNLMKVFYIDEHEICRETSIIEPVQWAEKTLLMSSLIYLIYGDDFSGEEEKEGTGIKKARREAVSEYIQKRIDETDDQLRRISMYATAILGMKQEDMIQETAGRLEELEKEMNAAVADSGEMMDKIVKLEEQLAFSDVLLDRYKVLASQYKSDIRRLNFIVDGEKVVMNLDTKDRGGGTVKKIEKKYDTRPKQVDQRFEHVAENHNDPGTDERCPYCGGSIRHHEKKQSYLETARKEMFKIIRLLANLTKTVDGVEKERQQAVKELEEARERYAQIEHFISDDLQPKKERMAELLNQYRESVEHQSREDTYNEIKTGLTEQLVAYRKEEEKKRNYKPKDQLDEGFRDAMDAYADEILQGMQYPGFVKAHFNLKSFDIEVNGGTKVDDHGKGYCAFLNTVVALMMHRYLVEHGTYMPGILMVDSPLHGMYQGVEDDAPESMKTGMFSYLSRLSGQGQVIVAENSEHVPQLEYARQGVNEIVFKKNSKTERHGFLLDVYHK